MRAVQQVVDGLATGSIYGALALALVLVHRATGVVNFAQGQMAVVSTFVAWSLSEAGLGVVAAIALAVVISLAFGAAVERLVMRRFERESPLIAVVVTVGLLVSLNGFSGFIWGFQIKPFPPVFSGDTIRAGGVTVAIASLGSIAVLVAVVVGLQVLFLRTRLGLALRAVADNPESSALSGLPVGGLLMVGWGLAAGLGALAGCMVAPKIYLEPNMLAGVIVYALAAAILGGLDSPLGAVVAAWRALGSRRARRLGGVALVLGGTMLVAVVPLSATPYTNLQLALVATYGVAILGLNLVTGYAGQISLGQSAVGHPPERGGRRLDGRVPAQVQGAGVRLGRRLRRRGRLALRLHHRFHLACRARPDPQRQPAVGDDRRRDGQRARLAAGRRPVHLIPVVAGTVSPARASLLYGAILLVVIFFAPGGLARAIRRIGERLGRALSRRGGGSPGPTAPAESEGNVPAMT